MEAVRPSGKEEMTTEEEVEEFDEDDPFGLKKPQTGGRRTSLGNLARQNAVVRRKGEYGELEEDREDEDRPGFRPGTYYRPFN